MADPAASPQAASSLAGKRIVITRAVAQSSDLFAELLQHGAIPTSLPLVSFSAPRDYASLDAALRRWQEFDWVLFTSANAVRSVVSRSTTLGLTLDRTAARPRVAAVGPATQQEATNSALRVDHVAKTHLGSALAEELAVQLGNKNVFLPRSDRANPDLPTSLKQLGAKLTEVIAYCTLPPGDVDRDRASRVIGAEADAAVFFSPSAVHNLADLIGKEALTGLQNKIVIVAAGPVTSAALCAYGIQRIVTAADTTIHAVIDALESCFAATPTAKQPLAGAKHG